MSKPSGIRQPVTGMKPPATAVVGAAAATPAPAGSGGVMSRIPSSSSIKRKPVEAGATGGGGGDSNPELPASPQQLAFRGVWCFKFSNGWQLIRFYDKEAKLLTESGQWEGRNFMTVFLIFIDSGLADNFIVGDIVFVNGDGDKRGKICYIGDVAFAAGEFAGIALDKPNGS
jgi:hypothetical protein